MDRVKISFYVPKQLRTELNVIAAKQDKTVTSILTELVEQYVSENK
jgi:predicted DNA-binding protein